MMPQSLETGAAALGLNRPRTVKGAFNPSMVNATNQKTTTPADTSCCSSSIFSGLASKCLFWTETPNPSVQQDSSNNPTQLSFEDRATSDDDSGDEESDKEEEEEKEEENRASGLGGRNSHSTSIKIP